MDPLTHTLTGVLLSRAGLNRVTPHATWIVVLAANSPDIDVATAAGGALTYLNYHRHLTHAIVLLPVIAALPLLLVRWVLRRRFPWRRAYLASLIGAATHPLLDLTNVYGIRLGLPFYAEWYRLDITHVVDAWISCVLLLAVTGPMLSRLVSQEIGARPSPGRVAAYCGLAFLALYNGGRAVLHARAIATLESRVYQGGAPSRVAAFPDPFNPLRWRGLVETEDLFSLHDLNLTREFDPKQARVFYKPPPSPSLERARASPAIRDFLRFSQFPLWAETPVSTPVDGVRVTVTDLRFGTPPRGGFTATAILNRQGAVIFSGFKFD
jgi:inner membrane protein